MTLPRHKNSKWPEFPRLKRKDISWSSFYCWGKCIEWRRKHRSLSLLEECPGLNSPETTVLSAISGARLPLPGQEVFGFEVKHVSVCLSLLALAVHVFLGVLHHLLCLLCHLKNKQRTNELSEPETSLTHRCIVIKEFYTSQHAAKLHIDESWMCTCECLCAHILYTKVGVFYVQRQKERK